MKLALTTAMLLFVLNFSFADNPIFDVELIPAELKKDAHTIIRYSNRIIQVKSPSNAVLKISYAYTILNKNGLSDSYFSVYYDPNRKVRDISGTIYDSKGKKIKRLTNVELEDYSAISGMSIMDDSRIKVFDPEIREYPFTVEYKYELHFNGYVSLPDWDPYIDYNVAIEQSKFELSFPDALQIQHLEKNIEASNKQIVDGRIIINWEVFNQKPIDYEPFMSPYHDFAPYVFISPKHFEYEGYAGQTDSWKSFGRWCNMLLKDRDALPDETKIKMQELVQYSENNYDKVCAIYKYMQNNTRYVSVQEGIGGLQPFKVETVDRLKYGDCKALTNYTKALLSVVGIESFYTKVLAGEFAEEIFPNIPAQQSNHVFLCVPFEKDTLWLECTDNQAPCGYIGDFTDDRFVLVLNEEGGNLARTPKYSSEENRKISNISVDLFSNGNGQAAIKTKYLGPYIDEVYSIVLNDKTDQEKNLYKRLNLSKSKINSFSFEIVDGKIPLAEELINVDIGNLGISMGNNLFITPNLINKQKELFGDPKDRISDILVRRSHSNIDTVIFNLEQDISVAGLPKDIDIETDFGKYNCKYEALENKIVYIRYFEMKRGKFSKDRINELYDFHKSIAKADKQRIALKIL